MKRKSLLFACLLLLALPFYAAQVAASEEECLARNFIPIICNSNSNPGLESWYLEMLEERQAAGILLTTIQNEETFVKRIERLNMPVLLVDQGIENYTGDRVLFNFFKAGYMAAEYLIECGHKDLALASGPITRHNRREILRGFKQALLDYDIVFNKRRIVNDDSKYDIVAPSSPNTKGVPLLTCGRSPIFVSSPR